MVVVDRLRALHRPAPVGEKERSRSAPPLPVHISHGGADPPAASSAPQQRPAAPPRLRAERVTALGPAGARPTDPPVPTWRNRQAPPRRLPRQLSRRARTCSFRGESPSGTARPTRAPSTRPGAGGLGGELRRPRLPEGPGSIAVALRGLRRHALCGDRSSDVRPRRCRSGAWRRRGRLGRLRPRPEAGHRLARPVRRLCRQRLPNRPEPLRHGLGEPVGGGTWVGSPRPDTQCIHRFRLRRHRRGVGVGGDRRHALRIRPPRRDRVRDLVAESRPISQTARCRTGGNAGPADLSHHRGRCPAASADRIGAPLRLVRRLFPGLQPLAGHVLARVSHEERLG